MSDKFDVMSRMTNLDTVDADRVTICGVTRMATIKIVHWKARVA